jgi:aspartyl-tRNA(Asn)/glutamyl-tRNA(Gln) amidotransferase subunit A
VSAHAYLSSLRRRDEMKQQMDKALAGVDALLTPTTTTAAIPLAEVDQDQLPSRFTRFVNLLEMCALSLPNGFTTTGLPTSLQVACRGEAEALALRIGHAYQQATDWHEQTPAMLASQPWNADR